jgi:hypothetical protein
MRFELRKVERNTQAYWVQIGEFELSISYQTVIAIQGPGMRHRRNNDWGPTTGKHFRDLRIHDGGTWQVVDEKEMDRLVELAIMETGLKVAAARMGAAHPEALVAECLEATSQGD